MLAEGFYFFKDLFCVGSYLLILFLNILAYYCLLSLELFIVKIPYYFGYDNFTIFSFFNTSNLSVIRFYLLKYGATSVLIYVTITLNVAFK